jgi:hypothetical protein
MFKKYIGPFFAPADSGAGGGDDPGELEQDLADLDADPDPDLDPDNKDKDKDRDDDDAHPDDADDDADPDTDDDAEEEDPDAEDDEKDEKDKKDDKGEKAELSGRPTIKDIKSFGDGKYKDLFKDFPDLRKAYFQVGAFQEVFADPQEAQAASSKAAEFDVLEQSLVDEGDPTTLLKTLSENNPKALKKIVGNFATSLRNVEPESIRP